MLRVTKRRRNLRARVADPGTPPAPMANGMSPSDLPHLLLLVALPRHHSTGHFGGISRHRQPYILDFFLSDFLRSRALDKNLDADRGTWEVTRETGARAQGE